MMNKSWVFPVEKWSDYPQGKQAVATGVRPAEATADYKPLYNPPYVKAYGQSLAFNEFHPDWPNRRPLGY